jgi:hypothetical protein
MTAAERHESARQFYAGEAALLLATDAASEGLNLHRRCRLVINLELPWTPVRLEQRIGRVERIGQTRRVHAVHLLAHGTSEEQSVARLVLRGERAARVLNEMRPDYEDRAVAEVVIGGAAAAARATPAPLRDVVIPALRDDAEGEARRLELARRLLADADPLPLDPRPCVTILKRRGINRIYWVYRMACVDEDAQMLWEAFAAFVADVRVGPSRWRDVRDWLGVAAAAVAPAVSHQQHTVAGRATSAIQTANELAARRERAIEHVLASRQARLSAAVMQRGLFDRRSERAATAQSAVLEEALERCRVRLRQIASAEAVSVEEASLAFAVLVR